MNFDRSKYKVLNWKSILNLHWIINPGLFINELILGQRIPKVSLFEKDSNKPFAYRSFVPCPQCNTIHSSLKWSAQNKTAFKNWFGLYCDHCGKSIPCLRNLTSLLILAITFPVWVWFRKRLKQKWFVLQKERFSKTLDLATPGYNWVSEGLSWGSFMFIIMELGLNPLINGNGYHFDKLGLGFAFWILGGLAYGFFMKKVMTRQLSRTSS